MLQLILAAFLGSLLGLQRELEKKSAGIRTYAFVAVGSCLFTMLSATAFGGVGDPARVAAQVVVGIGFLGAGIIFFREGHIEGLTTAAGLWVTAAIGMAVGIERYALALMATVVAFFLFLLGRWDVEAWYARRKRERAP